MKDDTKEKPRPAHYFRYGILASLAILVISLGLALTPGPPQEAPEPAFSERARTAALTETMQLRLAGRKMADSFSGAERQALLRTVTLLTTQARALTGTDPEPYASATGAASASGAGTATATPAAQAEAADSPAALVAALSASGRQRLEDAAASDGGMARLLAAVGTAQVLQATSLAPALGAAAPAAPESPAASPTAASLATASPTAAPAAPSSATASPAADGSCPPASTESGPADGSAEGSATPKTALAMTVKTEAETVYGYQVALARLDGAAAGSASELLARHESVLAQAEALSRALCVDIPPREAGYTLGPSFLASPAAGLGSLEAGTLPVYGDLVALSGGSTRQWAISGLLAAANRAVLWGSDPGPLPGIVVDTAQLPELPQESPSQETTAPGASTVPSDAG
ncbi:ferritin-like domain-containing protein [Arthrobacter sp. CC3]|uniref:ferritin-like domain-containing protein n=1 Tax=Arthrobacter sp. CC3 TaxID=3029185 RepID=UPI0032657EAA